MDTLETNLVIIKDGLQTMVKGQEDHEKRIHGIEAYLNDKKRLGFPGFSTVGMGTVTKEQVATKIVQMGIANAMQREGCRDSFQRAGFSSYDEKMILDAQQKAMDTGTSGSGGGYIVPSQWVAVLIEMLRAKMVTVRAGATLMQGLTGSPVTIPKQLTSSSLYWIGQNANITQSDPTFGQVQMTPKTLAARAQYSNLLGILSNPQMEQIIRNDFMQIAALELDRVALRGSGSSNQPLGVANAAGVSNYAIGTNGGALQIDHLYDLIGALDDADIPLDSLAVITHPKALRKLKKSRVAQFSGDTGGSYILPPLLTDEALSKAIGLQCLSTTQLPVNLTKGSSSDCTEVYCGNWADLLIGQWGSVEILATNIGGNAWAQNAIEVRLIMNVDVQVRHAQSFVLCNDARTA
ncbi:MAG: hypothetical protein OJF51_004868 [Nitrospira sp.]|jgi:HK97 family phage major capsid protein|nr:MAG: hypothetical protein OJF51_004868 [Nitrospira sp.]